jgi:hypothetical protein
MHCPRQESLAILAKTPTTKKQQLHDNVKFRLREPHFRNTWFFAVRQGHKHSEDKTISAAVIILACLVAFGRPCTADLNSRPIVHELLRLIETLGHSPAVRLLHAANYITPLLASSLVKDSHCLDCKYSRHNRYWKTNYGRTAMKYDYYYFKKN